MNSTMALVGEAAPTANDNDFATFQVVVILSMVL